VNKESQKRKIEPVGKLPLGENFFLIGGLVVVLLAALGIAGIRWGQLRSLTCLSIFAFFYGTAFLVGSLKDSWKLGWTWRRYAAIVLSLMALALVTLAFHELFSATPFLQQL
jgi:hypothetical protein